MATKSTSVYLSYFESMALLTALNAALAGCGAPTLPAFLTRETANVLRDKLSDAIKSTTPEASDA